MTETTEHKILTYSDVYAECGYSRGLFDSDALASLLDDHAAQGWEVCGVFDGTSIILRRKVSYVNVTTFGGAR